MSLLYQNDPRLSERIAGYGCELLCTLAIPCLHVNRFLSPREVLCMTDYCIAARMIGDDLSLCYETSPHAVIRETFRALGIVDVQGYQVGSISNGKISLWRWYDGNTFDYAIHRGVLLNGAPHSVLLDLNLRHIYNPHPTKRLAVHGPKYLYKIQDTVDWKHTDGE